MQPSFYPPAIQVSSVTSDIWASCRPKLSAHQKLPILSLILQDLILLDDNGKTVKN